MPKQDMMAGGAKAIHSHELLDLACLKGQCRETKVKILDLRPSLEPCTTHIKTWTLPNNFAIASQ